MVRIRSLQRAYLPEGALTRPSPASLHSNRLALHVYDGKSCCLYFASGTRLYQAKVLLADAVVVKGKECLLIPNDVKGISINQLSFSPHRAEIQSLSISQQTGDGSVLLGAADSCGRIVVSCLGTEKGATYTACPQDAGVGERGWAGLAFVPGQPSLVAAVRGFNKSIDFYDKDLHVRTLRTLQHPTGITFLDGPNLPNSTPLVFAITEGPQISLWDLRASENGGCMKRILGSSTMDPLYAVCSSSDGLIGAGGAERSAVIFDIKRGTIISRWTNCLKYEITGMAFSALDSNTLYLHGLDYEVVCGTWSEGVPDSKRQHFTFRGDSRWLGFSKGLHADVMAGWCESGSLFIGEAVH